MVRMPDSEPALEQGPEGGSLPGSRFKNSKCTEARHRAQPGDSPAHPALERLSF